MALRDVTPEDYYVGAIVHDDDRDLTWWFDLDGGQISLDRITDTSNSKVLWYGESWLQHKPLPASLVPPQAVVDMALSIIRGRIRYVAPQQEEATRG